MTCRRIIPASSLGLVLALLVTVTAARAASPGEIVRNVEKQADKAARSVPPDSRVPSLLSAPDASAPADANARCRWVTQTITHQGVSQTRNVRICRDPAWWKDWMAKAQPPPAPQ